MSVASAVLALAREFDFNGVKITLRPLTYEHLAKFSLWLEERSRTAMMRAGGDPEWRAAHLSLVATGQFEPGSATFHQAQGNGPGARKIMELMIDSPDAERLSWELHADDKAFAEIAALAQEMNSDPLAKRARSIPGPFAQSQ